MEIWSSSSWFLRCRSTDENKEQSFYYFGFHYGEFPGEVIACGGATDFSGEGGHAKELAEAFIDFIEKQSLKVIELHDHEIGFLISKMLEEKLA